MHPFGTSHGRTIHLKLKLNRHSTTGKGLKLLTQRGNFLPKFENVQKFEVCSKKKLANIYGMSYYKNLFSLLLNVCFPRKIRIKLRPSSDHNPPPSKMLESSTGVPALGDRTNTEGTNSEARVRKGQGQEQKDVIVCECGASVKQSSMKAHTKTKKHLAFVQEQSSVPPAPRTDRSDSGLATIPPGIAGVDGMMGQQMQSRHMQAMHAEHIRYLQWQQMQAFHAQAAYFAQNQNYFHQQPNFHLQQHQQHGLASVPPQQIIHNQGNHPAGSSISPSLPQAEGAEDLLCSTLASVHLDKTRPVDFPAKKNEPRARKDGASQTLDAMVERLRKAGVPFLQREQMVFGNEIGRGAFGTVRQGSMTEGASTRKVAIKTLLARGDAFATSLADFEREAIAGWRASETGRRGEASRIAETLGVTWELSQPKTQKQKQKKEKESADAQLHLVLELAEARGTLHEEFGREEHVGAQVGRDTRAGSLVVEDEEGIAFLYTMPRSLKLLVARELAAVLVELHRAGVVHNDIKPSNLLVTTSSSSASPPGDYHPTGLLLIDFGEGELASAAGGKGRKVGQEEEEEWESPGTPGYQAPEVFHAGQTSSASDVYSAGVAMLEVWVGDLWETSEEGADEADGASDEEEDDEDFEATRKQVLAGLEKMSGAEAEVGSILARCLSVSPQKRPSPDELLRLLDALPLAA